MYIVFPCICLYFIPVFGGSPNDIVTLREIEEEIQELMEVNVLKGIPSQDSNDGEGYSIVIMTHVIVKQLHFYSIAR
jgi:hypothetical protein